MILVVAHGHHLRTGFEHEQFRREHIAFEPFHEVRRPRRLRRERVLFGVDLPQALVVELVSLPVHREQAHRLPSRFGQHTEARDEHVAVPLAHTALTDVSEHAQQLAVVLTVLFVEVTDHRIELAPRERFGDEPLRIAAGARIPLTRGQVFRTRCDHVVVAGGDTDRRQLEEIARKHHLQPAERTAVAPYDAADLVDHVEQPCVHHRDLVDDEHVRRVELGAPAAADELDELFGERGRHARTAP